MIVNINRELKRVPLNFKWEIGKIWSGYINPFTRHKCVECDGMGSSKDYEKLKDEWYDVISGEYIPNPYNSNRRYNPSVWRNNVTQEDVNALIEEDRLWYFTRTPINEEQNDIVRKKISDGGNSWLPFNNGYIPTAKEVNEWNLQGLGHDSLNASIIIRARLERESKPVYCEICDGSGEKWEHDKAKYDYENWEPYEPPEGEGFQLWGTTDEGHPKTPVFETIEELCEYCEKKGVSKFGRDTATKEEWLKILT